MSKISKFLSAGFLITGLLFSCTLSYQAQKVQYNDYRIAAGAKQDSSMLALLRPYTDSLSKSMNDVVAVSETDLEKKQPEGSLGNFLADAMLAMAQKSYATHVDAAFINYGGIRLPSLPAGNITRSKVFELSPFDNLLIIQKINGKVLQEFLDHIAGRGGWPCSGITMQIKNKKAINVTIGGAPLNASATYTIANNDYVANGGDDCAMLKPIPQVSNGYIFRDAVFDYLAELMKQGKKIAAKTENRVSNAE
ncbi:MAG TPA: 5'-nucleotidase C-terminal domain-containing protein [Ferruginibacter sp.]|nr:5'-nucleotidase C-terminal domain-containing protein [Ferruginibacter sp.]